MSRYILCVETMRLSLEYSKFRERTGPLGAIDLNGKIVNHQGFKALRWVLSVFKPKYHFHGHIHIYDRNTKKETDFLSTQVINTYGYIVTEMEIDLPNG